MFFFAKKSAIKTRIANYCASSTECSDYFLKKENIFFKNRVVFSAWYDKMSLTKNHNI